MNVVNEIVLVPFGDPATWYVTLDNGNGNGGYKTQGEAVDAAFLAIGAKPGEFRLSETHRVDDKVRYMRLVRVI